MATTATTHTALSRIPLILLLSIATVLISAEPADAASAKRGSAAGKEQVFSFPEANFRLTVPISDFQSLDPKDINPDAIALFYHAPHRLSLLIIAEAVGPGLATNKGVISASQAHVQGTTRSTEFSDTEPARLGPLHALKYYTSARLGSRPIYYIHWVAEHQGYIYQFTASSRLPVKPMEEELTRILSSLELIDPKQVAGTTPPKKIGFFKSQFGYTVDLANTGWGHWEDADDHVWYPDLAGKLSTHSVFVMVPVCYADWQPKEQAIKYALLRTLGLDYPSADYQNMGLVSAGGLKGEALAFSFHDEENTPFYYNLYLFKRGACTHLLAVWNTIEQSITDKLSEQILNSLTFVNTEEPSPPERTAWFHNSAGLYYHQLENYADALIGFRHAALTDPKDSAYVNNAASAYNRLARYSSGLEFFEHPRIKSIDSSLAHYWEGWFHHQLQEYQPAVIAYQKGLELDDIEGDDLVAYIRSLIYSKEYDQAQAVVDKYAPQQPGVELIRAMALLQSSQGNTERAIKILQDVYNPLDPLLVFNRLDILSDLQRHEEVIDITSQLIDSGASSALAYHYRGAAQYQLKRYLDAKQSFEAALQLAPGDADVIEYLRFADAHLGKGDSASISTEIKPVQWPELSLPQQVIDVDLYDSYYEAKVIAHRYAPGQPLKTTHSSIIRVQDQIGVKRYSTLTAEFNPLSEKLYINRLLVRDRKGQLVSQIDRTDLYISDAEDYDQATFGKVVRAPVAGLAPGYSIEFVYTTEQLLASDEFSFDRQFLSTNRPVGVSALYLEGELESLLYNQANVPPPKRSGNSLLWIKENPPISQNEPMQVDPAEYLASVALTNQKSWRTAGRDYRDVVQDVVTNDTPELQSLINTWTANIDNNDQSALVAALSGHVQRLLTYKALEFGVRGYTPNTPSKILVNRFGDCKDHSVLLWRLLTAVDIPAELALANLSGPVDPDLPSIDQFDHMIVYLPEFRGGTFIDAINKSLNLVDYTPASLGDTWSLVLSEQPTLIKIPEQSTSHVSVLRDLELQPDGNIRIQEKVRMSAYFASSLRSHFKDIERHERLNWIQRFLGDGGEPIRMLALDIDHLFEPNNDLILNLQYQIEPHNLITANGAMIDPAYWERYYLSDNLVHNRQTDFAVSYPLIFETEVTYRAPHLEPTQWHPAQKNYGEEAEFGQYQSQWHTDGSTAKLVFRYETQPGRHRASDYSRYQKFSTRALAHLRPSVKPL